MAFWLNDQQIDIDHVLVSPYLRARETLDVVQTILSLPEENECLSELTPGGDAQLVAGYLRALAKEGAGTALVVSHLPMVGYLVASLCPGETAPMFATSAIASVTVEAHAGNGVLDWLVSPAQLTLKS